MTQHIANVIGIDPGFTGGVAIVNIDFQLVDAWQMPTRKPKNVTEIDARQLADMIDQSRCKTAYVEFVVSRPRQAHQFRFGISTGVVHGVLETLGLTVHTIAAQRWKAGVGLAQRAVNEHTSVSKARSRALAAKVWPAQAHLFKRTTDDGVAEAALIALYGMGLEKDNTQ